MHFKLIIAFVEDKKTDEIMDAAREAGATGCTVVSNARAKASRRTRPFLALRSHLSVMWCYCWLNST
jgi:hypothetical protein